MAMKYKNQNLHVLKASTKRHSDIQVLPVGLTNQTINLNLSIMRFIRTLEIKKGAPFLYTNLSRTYPDEINNKGEYINSSHI